MSRAHFGYDAAVRDPHRHAIEQASRQRHRELISAQAKKLRCHLPLLCPAEGCRIRVGDEVVQMRLDKAIIFDDSFNHEAWNDHPEEARIALIFDVWHPDLSTREVKFLSFLQTAAMKRAKAVCAAAGVEGDTFYSVIDQGRRVRPEDARVWGAAAAAAAPAGDS